MCGPGILKRGPTQLIIIIWRKYGRQILPTVEEILSNGLLPFIQSTFPDGHRFQQDNDPKHESAR